MISLLLAFAFDEVPSRFSLPWIAPLGAVIVAIAWLYMRQVDIPLRATVLAGDTALLLGGANMGMYLYWGQDGMELGPSITLSVRIGLVMLLPALMRFLYNLFEPEVQG